MDREWEEWAHGAMCQAATPSTSGSARRPLPTPHLYMSETTEAKDRGARTEENASSARTVAAHHVPHGVHVGEGAARADDGKAMREVVVEGEAKALS